MDLDKNFNWTEEIHFISSANLDLFPENNPNRFTNVFENQVTANSLSAIGLTDIIITPAGPAPPPPEIVVDTMELQDVSIVRDVDIPIIGLTSGHPDTNLGTLKLKVKPNITGINLEQFEGQTLERVEEVLNEIVRGNLNKALDISSVGFVDNRGVMHQDNSLITQRKNSEITPKSHQYYFSWPTQEQSLDNPVYRTHYELANGPLWSSDFEEGANLTFFNFSRMTTAYINWNPPKKQWSAKTAPYNTNTDEEPIFKITLTMSDGTQRVYNITGVHTYFLGSMIAGLNSDSARSTDRAYLCGSTDLSNESNIPIPATSVYGENFTEQEKNDFPWGLRTVFHWNKSETLTTLPKKRKNNAMASMPTKKTRLFGDIPKNTSSRFLQIICPQLTTMRLAGNDNAPMLKLVYVEDIENDYIHVQIPSIEFAWKTFSTNLIHFLTFEIYDGSGKPHPKFSDPNKYILTIHCRVR